MFEYGIYASEPNGTTIRPAPRTRSWTAYFAEFTPAKRRAKKWRENRTSHLSCQSKWPSKRTRFELTRKPSDRRIRYIPNYSFYPHGRWFRWRGFTSFYNGNYVRWTALSWNLFGSPKPATQRALRLCGWATNGGLAPPACHPTVKGTT